MQRSIMIRKLVMSDPALRKLIVPFAHFVIKLSFKPAMLDRIPNN
jgi:hypothetical protein